MAARPAAIDLFGGIGGLTPGLHLAELKDAAGIGLMQVLPVSLAAGGSSLVFQLRKWPIWTP
jgi:hypothetical protein